uniref:Uncharacterized protein n=1 Tax=Rhodopseudomonas palustris (strain DX-1) TaxID=652103 RepID=E6VMK9_RHOPX
MSTSSTQETSSTTAPWQAQQPYLKQAWDQAQTNLTAANGNTYSGEQVAQMTPEQLATFRQMIGAGSDTSSATTATNAGTTAANAGSGALTSALSGLTGYSPSGGTDSNIAAATAYANNPAVDGMVQSAMRDATRQVTEQAMPHLARSSALSGNTMSSKSALAEGVLARGLADKTADTSATIRGNLFNQGLSLAENGRQADNASRLGALTGAASAGTGALSAGTNALNSGVSQLGNLFQMAATGGSGLQSALQLAIDNERAKTEYGNNAAANNLANFWNVVGSGNWGGESQGKTTSTPSTWSTIASTLGAGSSIFKLFTNPASSVEMMTGLGNGAGGHPYPMFK